MKLSSGIISITILDGLFYQEHLSQEGESRHWHRLRLNTDLNTWPPGIQPKRVLSASLILDYFQFLPIISNIAMSVLAQTTPWGSVIISLAEFLVGEWLGQKDSYRQTTLLKVCTSFPPTRGVE